MSVITVPGLSEETVALLQARARERGVDLTTMVRELVDLGLQLEVVTTTGSPSSGAPPPTDVIGPLETADPEHLWSH